tara:strand:- start:128 stop:697 length:570 start_codon:yes stop_codon:yes gene_type:complete
MPNRINRVDQKESYNITVSWLDDFAKSLNKNAQIVEIFRNQNREKFATIEEKMSDMKNRAGFEKIKNLKEESKNIKNSTACGCAKCDKCDKRNEVKGDLKKIISYISEMISDRPEISYMQVVDDCRSLPLYQKIQNNLEDGKFVNYVKDMVSENSTKLESSAPLNYVSHLDSHQFGLDEDMEAPYMPKK